MAIQLDEEKRNCLQLCTADIDAAKCGVEQSSRQMCQDFMKASLKEALIYLKTKNCSEQVDAFNESMGDEPLSQGEEDFESEEED